MKININKKLVIVIVLVAIAILAVLTVFAIIKKLTQSNVPATNPQGLHKIDIIPVSSLKITTPAEALAAVNGILNVTVEANASESIDRIEYSVNGVVAVTAKEAPYAADIDVASLALGTYTLRGVMVGASSAILAEAAADFTIVRPEQSVKPPAPAGTISKPATGSAKPGSTGGGGSSGGGGSTGGGSTPGGGTTPPPVTLLGWQLSSTNVGLTPHGLSCGSLPSYTGSSKPAAGTLISGKRVNTTLDLSNGNITIEKSCIRPTSVGQGLSVMTTTDLNNCNNNGCPVTPSTVTIRDSEIDGSLAQTSDIANGCALVGIATMQRNYIHHTGSGICMYNTGNTLSATIENNYVHQLRAYGSGGSGSHNEAFTVRDFPTNSSPSRRMNVYNNRFDASSGNDTGAAFIQTYGDDINEVRFEGNLFEGQGYQLGMESGFGNIYGTAMRSINNRFSGTGYGPAYVTRNGLSYGWGEWRENYLNNPSAANNKGAAVGAP